MMLTFHDTDDQDTAAAPPETQRRNPAPCPDRPQAGLKAPLEHTAPNHANIPEIRIPAARTPAAFSGDFTIACAQYPVLDLTEEITRMTNIFTALFDAAPLTLQEHANLINAQNPLFPLLAVNGRTNRAVVLHAITVYQPKLGTANWHHPAMGKTIAMMGDAPQDGILPTIITIPATAFHRATYWPIAPETAILGTLPNTTTLLPPGSNLTIVTSTLVPLPPLLVPFFIQNQQTPLLQVFKNFLAAVAASVQNTKDMCHQTLNFLRAATITNALGSNPDPLSQLALDLTHTTMDADLHQWAAARYEVYHLLAEQNQRKNNTTQQAAATNQPNTHYTTTRPNIQQTPRQHRHKCTIHVMMRVAPRG